MKFRSVILPEGIYSKKLDETFMHCFLTKNRSSFLLWEFKKNHFKNVFSWKSLQFLLVPRYIPIVPRYLPIAPIVPRFAPTWGPSSEGKKSLVHDLRVPITQLFNQENYAVSHFLIQMFGTIKRHRHNFRISDITPQGKSLANFY